jgi:RNA polymerase sigma-70 factor (ECF subfamily)
MPNHDLYQMAGSIPVAQKEKAKPGAEMEYWLHQYYPAIHRLALSILEDENEADDAAQETFIAAHQSIDGFRQQASPKTWLFAIALNACRGKLRKRKVRLLLDHTLQALHLVKRQPLSPEDCTIQNETDRFIWETVSKLDEKHRLPILLRYVHELPVPEIADILHISQGTVHSRLHYARKSLHHQLGHLNPHREVPDEARKD